MFEKRSNSVSRRQFVRRTTAAGVATAVLGGASGTATADEGEEYPYEFNTIVNMVEVGADPTGEKPVDPLIHEYADDYTLLYFPAGRYKLEGYRNYPADAEDTFDQDLYRRYENFGLLGDGSGKSYFVAPQGQGSSGGYFERLWFEIRYGENLYVEGFTLDITAERTGGRFQLVPTGGFVMRDVRVEGVFDNPDGPLLFWVLDPDAHGLVENVRAPDGAESPTESFNATGIYVSALHKGTIMLRDCYVEGFTDNGLYASNPTSPAAVQVEGGVYRNNNIAQVRLGTSRSYVKNTRVEVTEDVETWYTTNMRGIRVADGEGIAIENCEVVMSADVPSSGAVVCAQSSGDVSVKDTRIHVKAPSENYAVHAKTPREGVKEGLSLQNVRIVGDASDGRAFRIANRESVSLQNVTVVQPGESRDGLYAKNSSGSLRDVRIVAGGDPLILEDSEFSTQNVETTDVRS